MDLSDLLAALPRGLFGASARNRTPLSGDYGPPQSYAPPPPQFPLSNDYGSPPNLAGATVPAIDALRNHTELFPNLPATRPNAPPISPPSVPMRQASPSATPAMGWADRFRILGAGMQDISAAARGQPSNGAERTMALIQASRQQAAQQAAQQDIADFAAGRKIQPRDVLAQGLDPQPLAPAPGVGTPALAAPPVALDGVSLPATSNAIAAPDIAAPPPVALPERSPLADKMGQPVTLANALPFLLHAQALGVDTTPYIEALKAAAPAPHKPVEGPDGLYDFDPASNSYKLVAKKPVAPIGLDPDKNYYLPDDGSQPAPGQSASAAPPPPQGLSVTLPAAGGGIQPRGVRNNNPLNVSALPNGQVWNGQTGTDGQYAVFATPEAGFAAADKNLQAYATKHGVDTVAGVISRWAPPGANDTPSYIATVSKTLGVDPNQKIDLTDPAVRQKVLTAMSGVELGKPVVVASAGATPDLQGGSAADGVAAAQVPGYRLVQSAHAQPPKVPNGYRWKVDGKELEPIPGGPADPTAGGPAGKPAGDTALTGDAYLKTLPAARAAQIQAMLTGRMAFPSSFALKTPYWQGMIADAAQVDPTFDATKFKAREAARTAFTKGVQGQHLVSINTLLGHLWDLKKASDALDNTAYPLINSGLDIVRRHGGDAAYQAEVAKYEAAKTAVASEAVRTLRGVGGAASDVRGWEKEFDRNNPRAARDAAIAETINLIGGRYEPLQTQYQDAMGPNADPMVELYPRAARIYKALGGDIPDAMDGSTPSAPDGRPRSSAAANAPRHAAPVRVSSPAQAAALPPGTVFITPDGRQITRR